METSLILDSFSFDMTGFNHPNQFRDFLNGYVTHPAYYHYKGTLLKVLIHPISFN